MWSSCFLLAPVDLTAQPIEKLGFVDQELNERDGATLRFNRQSSGFSYRRGPGPFSAGGSIRTDATAPATEELLKEVTKIRETPVSAAEIDMAKSDWERSLPGNFESTSGIVHTRAAIRLRGCRSTTIVPCPNKLRL